MKKTLLLLTAILVTSYSYCQISENYSVRLDSALWKYNSKKYNKIKKENEWIFKNNRNDFYVIQDTLLRENIQEAFSYVIFSNSDLSTNASAFGYSQNEEKTSVTINTNFRVGGNLSPLFIRTGANATGSNSIFEFYSDDSWRNNIGVNAGIILRVGTPGVFFKGKSFKSIHIRRKINAREPIYNYKKYSKNTIDSIQKLKTKLLEYDGTTSIEEDFKPTLDLFPKIQKLIKEKKYDEAYSELEVEEKNIKKFLKSLDDDDALDKYIENTVLYSFDKKNDITYGYSLKWFDFNINLGNSTYNFKEENIENSLLEEFQNSYKLNEDLNKLKTVVSFNFNHTHYGEKSIWYYQFGLSTNSGSYLENSFIDGTPSIIKNQDDQFIIKDDSGKELGLYENIDKNMATGSFNAYGAIFFTKKKNFGLNASATHQYLINKPQDTYFENNFSLLFGPIFRKVKDDKTSLTFGIDFGWENGVYETDITNNFTGRIRVGIPFNIYNKKKNDSDSK